MIAKPGKGSSDWATPGGCQPAISLALQSGRIVRVQEFSYTLTYSGLLEGCPDSELNSDCIIALAEWARTRFSEEPFTLPVETVQDAYGYEWLPPLQFGVLLTSTPVGGSASGSVAVICGFTSPFYDQPLRTFLRSTLFPLDWEAVSRDFLH